MSLSTENELRIKDSVEGRIQERGTVTIIARPGSTPDDTLLYLPRYKANPRKNIREDDLGLLSETMRLDSNGRREAPLQAAVRGYFEEMNDNFCNKEFYINPGKVYTNILFDTRKGWDTNVSHVMGYITVLWVNNIDQFPLSVDTEEMKGAEWLNVSSLYQDKMQSVLRQSPPSPTHVVKDLKEKGFLVVDPQNLKKVSWNSKLKMLAF